MGTERPIEEINGILFDGDDDAQEFCDRELSTEPLQQKTTARLLKQKELSIEIDNLEAVPYYKRPIVQTAVLLIFAVPLGWGLISAFSSEDTSSSQLQAANPLEDKGKQLLQQSLERERKKNQDLTVRNSIKTQQIEAVSVKPSPKPTSRTTPTKHQPAPIPQRVATPALRYVVTRPVSYPQQVRTSSPRAINNKPKPDPMEQWMAAAKAGSYGSGGTPNFQNISPQSGNDSTDTDTSSTLDRQESRSDSTELENQQVRGGIGDVPQLPETVNSSPHENLVARSSRVNQQPQWGSQGVNHQGTISRLVPGTQVSGKLLTRIVWRSNGLETRVRKQIPIELTQDLKDDRGIPVISKGSRVLAKVDSTDSTGLVKLSVIALKRANGSLEQVSPGTILVLNHKSDDEWLQAKIPRKNNLGRVSRDLGMIGLSELFDNSGAAQEALRQVNNRTLSRQTYQFEPTFFVLSEGTKVRIYVNGLESTSETQDGY